MPKVFKSNFSIRSILLESESENYANKMRLGIRAFNEQSQRSGSISPCKSPGPEDRSSDEILSVSSSKKNITPYSPFNTTNGLSPIAKPGFTYSALIVMAIRSSAQKRLPLSSICEWIAENFMFYKRSQSCWQNSIRHNLSLNPLFIRMPRALDDPGRGHYWALDPTAEDITIGETTGRLRRNNNSLLTRSYGPMPTLRVKAAFQYSNTGTVLHQPYQQLQLPPSPLVPAYCGRHFTPNAIYFPTPEETRLAQHTLLQQSQLEHQQIWAYYQRQEMLQQQQQQPLQQQTPILPLLPSPTILAANPALGYHLLQHAVPYLGQQPYGI